MNRKFLIPLAAAAAAALPAAGHADNAGLIDTATGLRCSAVFGIVAGDQQRGARYALDYPPLAVRGREFFVHIGARLMDDEHLTRPQMQQRFIAEARKVQEEARNAADRAGFIRTAMTPCLALLDATVPAR